MLASFAMAFGYLGIFLSHYPNRFFFANKSSLRQAHVGLGYLVIALTLTQLVAGVLKFNHSRLGLPLLRQHKRFGPLAHALGFMNIGLAVLLEEDVLGRPLQIVMIVSLVAVLSIVQIARRKSVNKVLDQEPLVEK
eukprot:c3450_g1_i1.p1 GENE.c3450_g1_i1~~c3450_g1_i1.p1  ORF type:complete len:136 (+),score=24.56 c3450_g1_i1:368-775(+)